MQMPQSSEDSRAIFKSLVFVWPSARLQKGTDVNDNLISDGFHNTVGFMRFQIKEDFNVILNNKYLPKVLIKYSFDNITGRSII